MGYRFSGNPEWAQYKNPAPGRVQRNMNMKKVMIVEDEKAAMDRILSMELWNKGDFTVCGTGSNGKEGFELLREIIPIIITDLRCRL